MDYEVGCSGCGRRHSVEAVQAGSSLACMCGRTVEVPRLSALRVAAGQTPIERNTIERIRAMIAAGKLPQNDTCPQSSRPVDTTIYFQVQCEHAYVKSDNDWNMSRLFMLLFLGWWAMFFRGSDRREPEEHGRNTIVVLPVRIAEDAAAAIKKLKRQEALKSLLRETPIYAKLLEEFPEAEVTGVWL